MATMKSASKPNAGASKPAAVAEVEAGALTSVDEAWEKLRGRTKLTEADRKLWVQACRAERARWILREKKREDG